VLEITCLESLAGLAGLDLNLLNLLNNNRSARYLS